MAMTNLTPLEQQVISFIDNKRSFLQDTARYIWQNPELAFEEYKATAHYVAILKEHQFQVIEKPGGIDTAFVASKQGRTDGPSLALLAEYDALPEIGHACGHNLFGAAALGAFLAIADVIAKLKGTVLLIGTPAEEGFGGKVKLLDKGVFDNVDAAIVGHADGRNVINRKLAARTRLSINFRGLPAHAGGSPHEGRNALNAAYLGLNAIDMLREYLSEDARIHGIISHGGDVFNTIPERVSLELGIRAASAETVDEIEKRVRECLDAGAMATGCKVDYSYPVPKYKNLINDSFLQTLCTEAMTKLGIDYVEEESASFSSDMGNISHEIPSLHPYFSIGPSDLIGHTQEFKEASISNDGFDGMIVGAKVMALMALAFFEHKEKG